MASSRTKTNKFEIFIEMVEKVGNKLPHPFWLFVSLSVLVVIISFIMSSLGVSVEYLKAARSASEAPVKTIVEAQNLLSKESLRYLFENLTSMYGSFTPLSLVMIMMLGVGFLEKTGMLSALIRKTILGVNPAWIIAIIAIVGVNGNLASDAGVIIVPTIAGAVFKSMGKNPWIGIIAGYAAANGGFSANFFIAGTDVLLSGITESVTEGLGIDAPVHPMMNWYFMCASTIVVVVGTVFVTEFFTKKRLDENLIDTDNINNTQESHELTKEENKGLKYCAIATIIFIMAILALTVPQNSLFRADNGNILPKSPLISSIVSILFLFFFMLGLVYGKVSGSLKSMKDVPSFMSKGLEGALGFMVIALPAVIFIDLFSMSNISLIIGVNLGNLLNSLNINGLPLLILFVFICTVMNLFMTSGSAKWLIIAPIFIPVMSLLGFSPAMVQATYRIGDTCTNIISPIDYYVPVIMGLLAMYNPKNKEVGIGTVISFMLPYSIVFMIGLLILLSVWYIFALPLGPGAPMFL